MMTYGETFYGRHTAQHKLQYILKFEVSILSSVDGSEILLDEWQTV